MGKVKEVFLRTPYNYDRNEASDESAMNKFEPTRTKQAPKEECDINTIVRRFGVTGQLPQNVRMPTYDDFNGLQDYHQAIQAVRQAAESFAMMPSNVRARFENDAGRFVDFCQDPNNREEAKKFGLLVPELLQQQLPVTTSAPAPEAPAPTKTPTE